MNSHSRHQAGQSIVILAITLVVLLAMVGLSVDVGNAYAQQRRVQSIANAGALAGMHAMQTNASATNNDVWQAVRLALTGNEVDIQGADYTYRVDYILANGSVVMLGEWNGYQANVINGAGAPPSPIERLQVTMGEQVTTYFARVVGRDTLTVNANGVACVGKFGKGVYPAGVPIKLRPPNGTVPGHRVFLADGTELPATDSRWGNWEKMRGMKVRIPLKNKSVPNEQDESDFIPGVHIAWLSWGGDSQTVAGVSYTGSSGGNKDLADGWTEPGTLQNGFLEGLPMDGSNVLPMRELNIPGDWISGEPGAHSALHQQFDVMVAKGTELMLPFFDTAGTDGSAKLSVRTVNMGRFRMTDYALTGKPKYIELEILGDGQPSAQTCSSEASAGWEAPDGSSFEKRFQIVGQAKVNQVAREIISSGVTHDIVLVVDTSDSMKYDWANKSGSQPGRIEDAKTAVKNFVRQLDISKETGDPDARIVFVTYSGSMDNSNLNVVVQMNWSKACSDAEILANNNCGGEDSKWTTIQTKAGQMTASGRTPGPIAFETVEQLLQNQRTPPAGKQYRQIVLFVTNSVFNVCGQDTGVKACSFRYLVPTDKSLGGNKENYYTSAQYNMESGRPIWQAQRVASRVKSMGVHIYTVALTPPCTNSSTPCFDPAGISDMSSGSGYYYQAASATDLVNVFTQIRQAIEAQAREKTTADTCVPQDSWQAAQGVKVTITQPENPSWSTEAVTDSSGAYQLGNLTAGQYVIKAEPLQITSSDGHTYTYSRTRNGYNLSEEGQASVYIDPQYPNGASVHSELWLSLPYGEDGTPLNGCTAP